jgi:hypothetical protein
LSVNVARYDQQAVLMANVEEARYQVLMSTDGKELVQARYAVRNNQRNFVKVTLPPGAAVWSVTLAGRPVRPGQSPDGSLLLPLEKSRRRRGCAGFRHRNSVSHQGGGVGGERPGESDAAGAGSPRLPHRAAAVLSAAVSRFRRARIVSRAGV